MRRMIRLFWMGYWRSDFLIGKDVEWLIWDGVDVVVDGYVYIYMYVCWMFQGQYGGDFIFRSGSVCFVFLFFLFFFSKEE